MALDPKQFSSYKYGGLGEKNTKNPRRLKRALYGGNVRIYETEDHQIERTDIVLKNGTVCVYKEFHEDYNTSRRAGKYTKIQILSVDNEELGVITAHTLGENTFNPMYKFFYGQNGTGSGSGDIALFIAQKLLGEEVISSFYLAGSQVDPETIEVIRKLLDRKTI